jgi:sulfate/thiosulfate transport system permease protein
VTQTTTVPPRPWARAKSGAGLGRWSLRSMTLLYLGALVVLPLIVVVSEGFGTGTTNLRTALATQGAVEAIRLTVITSALAAVINAVFGTLLAYIIVRFSFPGRTLLSAIIDMPFAVPTLVTGVMLVALYGPQSPFGRALESAGVNIAFTPLGILLALLFVTLPFVVRTVQPVLSELDYAEEEAAAVLGATGWTTFRRVVLPAIRPAITAGALLCFARALGEFGAIVVISGNITGRTLTAPVFIFQLTGQFRYAEAAAVATVLFLLSFAIVLITKRLLGRSALSGAGGGGG